MTAKQILISILIFGSIANNMLSMDPTEPKKFEINRENPLENIPYQGAFVAKNTDKGKYFYHILTYEEIKEEIKHQETIPCVYCPIVNGIILNTNDTNTCDALRIAILAAHKNDLEKKLNDIREILNRQ